MSFLATTEGALTRPMGPLPLWGWAAIGGVAFVGYRAISSHGARATPGGATAGGAAPSGAPPPVPGQIVPPAASVYNPTTGGIVTAPNVNIKDILGGDFKDFAKSLGPNYNSLSFSSGGTSIGISNSAQNILDAAVAQANYHAQEVNNTNFYHAQEVNNTNFYAAQVAANANFWDALRSYWGSHVGTYPPATPGITPGAGILPVPR